MQQRDAALPERTAESTRPHLAPAGTRPIEREEPRAEPQQQEAASAQELKATPIPKPVVRKLGSDGLRQAEPLERPVWEMSSEDDEVASDEPTEDAEVAPLRTVAEELEEAAPDAPVVEAVVFEEVEPEAVDVAEPEAVQEPEPVVEIVPKAEAPAEAAPAEPAAEEGAVPANWEQADLFTADDDDLDDLYDAIEQEDEASAGPSLYDDEVSIELGDEPEAVGASGLVVEDDEDADLEDEEAELEEEEDDEEYEDEDAEYEEEEDEADDEDFDEEEAEYEDEDEDEEAEDELEEEAELDEEEDDEEYEEAEDDLEEEAELDEEEDDEEEDDEEYEDEEAEDDLEEEAELDEEEADLEDEEQEAPEPAVAASEEPESAEADVVLQPAAPAKDASKGPKKAAQKAASAPSPAESESGSDSTPERPGSVAPPRVPGPVDDGRVFEAGILVLERGRVAVSLLQREFGIDFDEATALLDALQSHGLIGPYVGGRTREILLSPEEWAAKAPAAG